MTSTPSESVPEGQELPVGSADAEPTTSGPDVSIWNPGDTTRVVFEAVLLALGAGYLIVATQMRVFSSEGDPGPGFFPLLASTLMVVCLAIDIVRLLVARRAGHWKAGSGRLSLRLVAILGSIALYLAVVAVLGHTVTVAILTAILLKLFGSRRWWQIALIAVAVAIVTDLLFIELLGLRIPAGIFRLAVSTWI